MLQKLEDAFDYVYFLSPVLLLAVFIRMAACEPAAPQKKEVQTVIDKEVDLTIWHDDKNKVTCWIGYHSYSLVCLPDHLLRPNAEGLPAAVQHGQGRSSAGRRADEEAQEAAE